jgi:hypothetical protein
MISYSVTLLMYTDDAKLEVLQWFRKRHCDVIILLSSPRRDSQLTLISGYCDPPNDAECEDEHQPLLTSFLLLYPSIQQEEAYTIVNMIPHQVLLC